MKTPTLGPKRPRRTAERRFVRLRLPAEQARFVLRVATLLARGPGRGVRETALVLIDTGRYWRAERNTLRQGFSSLGISSIGDLIAGVTLGAMEGRLRMLPGLIIMIPGVIGMRGNIFGALASRLGTAMHSGMFEVSWKKQSVLMQNAYASTLLSIITSGFLAVLAKAVSAATGLRSVTMLEFLSISVVAGLTSGVVILAFTIGLARVASRRSWDMDSVAAPLVTFMGDVITLPSLFAASYIAGHRTASTATGIVLGLVCLSCLVLAGRTRLPLARRILRESIAILALAGALDLVAGTMVEHRLHHFIALPALLIMLPPFLEDAGALGGIVSARLASKLHLGAISPRVIPQRQALLDMSLAMPFALSVFTLVGVSSHLVALAIGKASPGLWPMVAVSLIAGALATLGGVFIAYLAGVLTFRFGLDPDNHGIPIVTSSMDVVGVICLLFAIVLLDLG